MSIPVTILSGFLGSGKTTLLNHLLRGDHGLRLAVIVNEFGQIGIDAATIRGGERFVELDNGCLCCAINADLERTVRDLLANRGFDQLVLETTGIADPVPVAWTFGRPGLSESYRVDAVVTVVDSPNLPTIVATAPEARLQIERADILVLNKLDLVSDTLSVEAQVRKLNASAPLLPAEQGQVPWSVILTSDLPSRFASFTPEHHHPSFESLAIAVHEVIPEVVLEELLDQIPANVYRIKGIVRTDTEWEWTLVNVVAGRVDLRPIVPPAGTRGALVFLGKSLDRPALEASLRMISSTP